MIGDQELFTFVERKDTLAVGSVKVGKDGLAVVLDKERSFAETSWLKKKQQEKNVSLSSAQTVVGFATMHGQSEHRGVVETNAKW